MSTGERQTQHAMETRFADLERQHFTGTDAGSARADMPRRSRRARRARRDVDAAATAQDTSEQGEGSNPHEPEDDYGEMSQPERPSDQDQADDEAAVAETAERLQDDGLHNSPSGNELPSAPPSHVVPDETDNIDPTAKPVLDMTPELDATMISPRYAYMPKVASLICMFEWLVCICV